LATRLADFDLLPLSAFAVSRSPFFLVVVFLDRSVVDPPHSNNIIRNAGRSCTDTRDSRRHFPIRPHIPWSLRPNHLTEVKRFLLTASTLHTPSSTSAIPPTHLLTQNTAARTKHIRQTLWNSANETDNKPNQSKPNSVCPSVSQSIVVALIEPNPTQRNATNEPTNNEQRTVGHTAPLH